MYYCIFRKALPHDLVAYPTTKGQFDNEWAAAISTLDGSTADDYICADYAGEITDATVLALGEDGRVHLAPNLKNEARQQARSEVRQALNKLGLSDDVLDQAGIGF